MAANISSSVANTIEISTKNERLRPDPKQVQGVKERSAQISDSRRMWERDNAESQEK